MGWNRQKTEISKIRGTLMLMKTTQAGIRITKSWIARAKTTLLKQVEKTSLATSQISSNLQTATLNV